MKCVSVEQMRAIELEANSLGITNDQMMLTAGEGLAKVVMSQSTADIQKTATGLIGSGNNGGDAVIALINMSRAGWKTTAYLVRPRQSNDPLLQQLKSAGGEVVDSQNDKDFRILDLLVHSCGILLDGILGTGFTPPIRQEIGDILTHIKNINPLPFVAAVDCPSGVDCNVGSAAPETLPAQITICLEAVKNGLLKLPAFEMAGKIQTVSLNLPADLLSSQKINHFVVDPNMTNLVLPKRGLQSHKGSFGTLLITAGSINYPGAALLAGKAACRVGVGLVQMAAPEPVQMMLAGHLPEVTWIPLPHGEGVLSVGAVDRMGDSFKRAACMLLGPGFGQHLETSLFIHKLFSDPIFIKSSLPLVIDADGLRLVGQLSNWPTLLPAGAILTPHPGEMAALTGLSITEVQADRIKIARQYAQSWGHVVVLKGALTVIASPGGQVYTIPVATPALAHAGTGDVLAGMIAGLRAQRMDPFEAAWAGAYLHACAGRHAAKTLGNTSSVLAMDVCENISFVLSELNG